MSYDDYDYDEYDAEDEEDLEALFVKGMLHDEEARGNKNKGGGCLTTVLTILLIPAMVITMAFSLFGCGMQKLDGDGMVRGPFYAQISQDEAKFMMKDDDGHVIVDVRRADEYAKGHIPGAILIPNEEIGIEQPKELPDKNQIILVH